MVQRGLIKFSGAENIFRISKPGVEVSSAAASDLLMDERVLYAQIVDTGIVANPGSGAGYTATVPITNKLSKPVVAVYPYYNGALANPAIYSYLSNVPGYVPSHVDWSVSSGALTLYFTSIVSHARYFVLRTETP